jgi:hypothetical protein
MEGTDFLGLHRGGKKSGLRIGGILSCKFHEPHKSLGLLGRADDVVEGRLSGAERAGGFCLVPFGNFVKFSDLLFKYRFHNIKLANFLNLLGKFSLPILI